MGGVLGQVQVALVACLGGNYLGPLRAPGVVDGRPDGRVDASIDAWADVVDGQAPPAAKSSTGRTSTEPYVMFGMRAAQSSASSSPSTSIT